MSPGLSILSKPRNLILVVDDEPSTVSSLCEYLSLVGHRVIGSTCRSEALALARHNADSLALVIMDVMLEDDLGPVLVDEMLQTNHSLKVLYLSGFAHDEAVYRSEAKLPLAFLHKPCSLQTLRDTVERMMAKA